MRILVVGSGGREHAMCRALATGDADVLVTPGNGGTTDCATNVSIQPTDVPALVAYATNKNVDLVVPGPEATLVAGLADALAEAGVLCCGPSRSAARLEGSKAFMRELTQAAGVPGARFAVVESQQELDEVVASWDGLPVVKADGLAAGKGVLLPKSKEGCVAAGRALLGGRFGDAGRRLVIEERLQGTEASLFFACDGRDARLLPHARDHKRLGDDDVGPNTGGMGAISPNPMIDSRAIERVRREIVEPTLAALEDSGAPYRGFLYAGVMLTQDGPRVLEFNVRLGDPEAQAILPRLLPGQFLAICEATARGRLAQLTIDIDPRPTCAVVLAAFGYPDKPRKGDLIDIEAELTTADRWLDHAGTRNGDTGLVTAGGRVAAVVARADDAKRARQGAYEGVERVHFAGKHFRMDIGRM